MKYYCETNHSHIKNSVRLLLLCIQFVVRFQPHEAFGTIQHRIRSSAGCKNIDYYRQKQCGSYSSTLNRPSRLSLLFVVKKFYNNVYHYYPPEVLQQIKDHVSIIDVIRDSGIRGLNIHSNNKRATALCPFHDDTNPSFAIVDDDKMKMYKCFACGATGDIFTYLLQQHISNNNITTFGQAVGYILQHYCEPQFVEQLTTQIEELGGSSNTFSTAKNYTKKNNRIFSNNIPSTLVEGDDDASKDDMATEKLKQRMILANAAAALFYFQNLYKLPSAGIARQHLLELRGFTPKLIREFCLGYAPPSNKKNPLVLYLTSLGFTPDELIQAGLAKVRESKNKNTTGSILPLSRSDDFDPNFDASHEDNINNNATRTKNNTIIISDTGSTSTTTSSNHHRYHKVSQKDLKDRFLNRLIIPIWDKDGTHVIGFGGRLLTSVRINDDADDDNLESSYYYNPPKYLNTQGTLIFQKRHVLFGINVAAQALNTSVALNFWEHNNNNIDPKELKSQERKIIQKKNTSSSSFLKPYDVNEFSNCLVSSPCVIIVEGYMDALALYNVGIRNVAATMGTSVSLEQLLLAANVISNCTFAIKNNTSGDAPSAGRIILLMDQDEAGISAVERLCSSSQILYQLTTTNSTNDCNSVVDVLIASLPAGCKDPDEFIQHKRSLYKGINAPESISSANPNFDDENIAVQQMFELEVVRAAKDWKDWYLNLLALRHASLLVNHTYATSGTYSIYEQASDFISTFPNPQMQSYLVQRFSNQLAARIDSEKERDENVTDHVGDELVTRMSAAEYKINLEKDLWGMINKKTTEREALHQRKSMVMLQLGPPVSVTQNDYGVKPRDNPRFDPSKNAERRMSLIQRRGKTFNPQIRSGDRFARKAYRQKKEEKVPYVLVPHFDGFHFENESDELWLNDGVKSHSQTKPSDRGSSLILGRGKQDFNRPYEFSYGDELRTKAPVYFNSNSYLGCPDTIERSNKILPVEALQENPDFQLMLAEEKMLRTLIEYSPARKAMKLAMEKMQKSNNGGTGDILEWSCFERKWLFHKLVGINTDHQNDALPVELLDGGTPAQLHDFLSRCEDAPAHAFRKNVSYSGSQRQSDTSVILADQATGIKSLEEAVDLAPEGKSNPLLDSNSGNYFIDDYQKQKIIEKSIVPRFPWNNESIGEENFALEDFLEDIEAEDILESSSSEDNSKNLGSLDTFFCRVKGDPLSDPFFSSSALPKHETLADLIVQETVATMLQGTAMKKLAISRDAWHAAKAAFLMRTSSHGVTYSSVTNHTAFQHYLTLDIVDLKEEVALLESRFKTSMDTAKELNIAVRRIGCQLLDYSSTSSIKKASTMNEDSLALAVDAFVNSLPEDAPVSYSNDDEDHYIIGYGGKKIRVESKYI